METTPPSPSGDPSTPVSMRLTTAQRVVTAVVAVLLVAGVVLLRGLTVTALAYAFFVVIGVVLSAIDLRRRIIPNRIVVPATGVGLVLLVAASAIDPDGGLHDGDVGQIVRVVVGGSALFLAFLVLASISPRGMGMGDVKMAAFIGIHLAFEGWRELLYGAAAAFVGAALVGAVLLITRRAARSSTIPFGPLMLLGSLAVLAADILI
jgi:leader peptidase (prepilin peptidase)/N-methyltransferase